MSKRKIIDLTGPDTPSPAKKICTPSNVGKNKLQTNTTQEYINAWFKEDLEEKNLSQETTVSKNDYTRWGQKTSKKKRTTKEQKQKFLKAKTLLKEHNFTAVEEMITKGGFDINSTNISDNTLLHIYSSTSYFSADIVIWLLKHNIDYTATNRNNNIASLFSKNIQNSCMSRLRIQLLDTPEISADLKQKLREIEYTPEQIQKAREEKLEKKAREEKLEIKDLEDKLEKKAREEKVLLEELRSYKNDFIKWQQKIDTEGNEKILSLLLKNKDSILDVYYNFIISDKGSIYQPFCLKTLYNNGKLDNLQKFLSKGGNINCSDAINQPQTLLECYQNQDLIGMQVLIQTRGFDEAVIAELDSYPGIKKLIKSFDIRQYETRHSEPSYSQFSFENPWDATDMDLGTADSFLSSLTENSSQENTDALLYSELNQVNNIPTVANLSPNFDNLLDTLEFNFSDNHDIVN